MIYENLAENFKYIRKHFLELTQKEMSILLEIRQSDLSNIESGKKAPDEIVLYNLMINGISTEYLFTKKGSIQTPLPSYFTPNTVGQRMRFFRESQNRTETQIALSLEIEPAQLYLYENNRLKIPDHLLPDFCAKEGSFLKWLETGNGIMNNLGGQSQKFGNVSVLQDNIENLKSKLNQYKIELEHLKNVDKTQTETIGAQQQLIDELRGVVKPLPEPDQTTNKKEK